MEVGELHRHLVVDGQQQVLPGLQPTLQVLAVLVRELGRSCGKGTNQGLQDGPGPRRALGLNSDSTPNSSCAPGLRNTRTTPDGIPHASLHLPFIRPTVTVRYHPLLFLVHIVKGKKGILKTTV